jgi:hypothetical protein
MALLKHRVFSFEFRKNMNVRLPQLTAQLSGLALATAACMLPAQAQNLSDLYQAARSYWQGASKPKPVFGLSLAFKQARHVHCLIFQVLQTTHILVVKVPH